MAFDVGSVVAHLKADITDFQNGMRKAQDETSSLKDKLGAAGAAIGDFASKASVLSAVAGAGMLLFLKQSSEEANNFAKSMTTLEIISGRFGVKADDAKEAAQKLGRELRIGVGPAAESLQNLFKSGLNLEQASDLLHRFTNEAITGKSPQISLAQAVQNLSFAYNTQNSALGNMSGVSENFQDIIEKGRAALIKEGKAASEVTDDMAKFRGMIDLTNLTLGSSEKFTGSLIDKQAQLDQKLSELKITVGQALNPVLAEFIDYISTSGAIEGLQKLAKNIGDWLQNLKPLGDWLKENKELVLTFLTGLAIGIGAILVVAPLIVIAMNPFILIFIGIAAAVALLYTAWNENFLGIQDTVNQVIPYVVDFFNNILIPAIKLFVEFWKAIWPFVYQYLKVNWDAMVLLIRVTWELISGILKIALAMLQGDWKKAWEEVKNLFMAEWNIIRGLFQEGLNFIGAWGNTVYNKLVQPFVDAWNRIQDLVNKIKDALDFTKRHSPSVVDIVNKGVGQVNRALENLNIDMPTISPSAAMNFSPAGANSNITQVTVSLDGAVIADESSAESIAEKLGDSIIRKLQGGVRF